MVSQIMLPLSVAYAQEEGGSENSEQSFNNNQNKNDHQNDDDKDDDKKDEDKKDNEDDDDDEDNNKVNICHAENSSNNPWNAINISSSALQTHLGHGDFLFNGPTKNGKPDNKDKKADKWCKDNAPVVPVDVCPNIPDTQETVPQGKELVNGQCVDIVVPVEPQQCDFVSDTTNIIQTNGNAVETWTHSAWVNSTVLGTAAKWIWNAFHVTNPSSDETETFTKNFNVTGTVTSAMLQIAADNGYLVQINGTTVVDNLAVEANYGSINGPIDVASFLVAGANSIKITVKNFGVSGSAFDSNPAGLLYKLSVTAGACSTIVPPPPAPTGSIEITKYVCPANFVPNRNSNGVDSDVPEGCTPASGVEFGYVYGTQTDANGPYPELEGTLISGGLTGENGKLIIGAISSVGRYLIKETNPANLLGLYCEGDGDTNPNNNDNQELTFVPTNGVAHCVAYNKAVEVEQLDVCPNIEGLQTTVPEGKQLVDGDCVDIVPPVFDMCSNIEGYQSEIPSGYHREGESNCVQDTSGSGGTSAGSVIIPQQTGQVLGATTSCDIYLDSFLKRGAKNNIEQVKKLQTFLNDYLKLNPALPVNGVFGNATFKAVVKFQEQESDHVLKPWVGITLKDTKKGTGYVYKTTITRINNIMCPDLNLPIPTLD